MRLVPHWPSPDSSEQRTVAGLRLLLTSAALVVVWIDPTQPETRATATYLALSLYTLYAAAVYGASLVEGPAAAFRRFEHWVDVVWSALLVGLSGGPNSLFFVLFFFPILVAAFRWGLRAGLATTAASTLLLLAVSGAVAREEGNVEWNRFLLRPVYLSLLGWVISQRGGFERLLRRRLELLKEIGRLSNPRLGTDRTIGSSLERLRAFYDADDCLLVTTGSADEGARLRRATRGAPERSFREDPLPADLAGALLALPAEHALVSSAPEGVRAWPWSVPLLQLDVEAGEAVPADRSFGERVAEWLGPGAFATVPVRRHGRLVGRLYLAGTPRRIGPGDVDFLLQVVDALLPILENVRLVDRLAASAAEEERRKIARDVHDSVIQPYIGLQIGLSALDRQLASGAADAEAARAAAEGVRRLLAVTESGVEDLRGFVARLRGGEASAKGFAAIVASFARRFGELTGIAVEVDAAEGLLVNDRLAAELFQMMAEGLSNVRRHSEAKRAALRLTESEGALTLSIENDGPERPDPVSFVPRSLSDRARALQGWVEVEAPASGGTRVRVTIPL